MRRIRECFLMCEILNPLTLLQHEEADDALDGIQTLTQGIQGENGNPGEAAQADSNWHGAHPHEAAVKQEGDKGLTAGTQGIMQA